MRAWNRLGTKITKVRENSRNFKLFPLDGETKRDVLLVFLLVVVFVDVFVCLFIFEGHCVLSRIKNVSCSLK